MFTLGLIGHYSVRRKLRRDVLAELALLRRGSGRYRDAAEKLTPLIHGAPVRPV